MRITEHAVRLGGDEFLIVLEEPGEDGSELLLERLKVAWRRRRPLPVDFSAGVAAVTGRVDAALEQADRALYDHKYARAAATRGRRDNR
jgi:GGDEF domain-containing protein